MARPMNPLPNTDTHTADPHDRKLVDFAHGLRTLREKAGNPSLATMSQRSGVCIALLSGAHGGHKMPTWRTVEGYVHACGTDSAGWRAKWERLQLAQRTARARSGHASIVRNWARLRYITPPQWPMNEAELAEILDQARRFRGLSLRDMAHRSVGFSHHTYGAVLRGDRPVTADILLAILHACGAGPGEVRRWMQVLARVRPTEELRVRSLLAKMPAPRASTRHRAGPPGRMSGGRGGSMGGDNFRGAPGGRK
ncbi:helix-turn-helix domain-containing protein [Streptomyces sp. NPDC058316]|uniref:helix-turn-helix domain-containing protein n=1 Tax=Streptomyces sp. NPDC058316 TaxID=3346442 RepID=UPI0036E642BD